MQRTIVTDGKPGTIGASRALSPGKVAPTSALCHFRQRFPVGLPDRNPGLGVSGIRHFPDEWFALFGATCRWYLSPCLILEFPALASIVKDGSAHPD